MTQNVTRIDRNMASRTVSNQKESNFRDDCPLVSPYTRKLFAKLPLIEPAQPLTGKISWAGLCFDVRKWTQAIGAFRNCRTKSLDFYYARYKVESKR